MFSGSNEETVIAEGLKIEGKVTADGLVRVHGRVLGDVRCAALVISGTAEITGSVVAEEIIVDGTVDGPIHGSDVVLKSNARVTGDIHHKSLSIERGATFIGRSKHVNDDAGAEKKKTPAAKASRAKRAPANDDARQAKAG